MVSHATSTATSAHPPCSVISKTLFRWFFGSKIWKGLHHHQRREDQTYDGLPWTHPGRWPCKLRCWDVCSCCDGRNVRSSGSWAGSLTGTKHTATGVQMCPPKNIHSSAVAKDETVDGRSLKSSAKLFILLRTKRFFSKVVAKMNFSFHRTVFILGNL